MVGGRRFNSYGKHMGFVRSLVILASRSPRRKSALRQIVPRFRSFAVREPTRAKGRTLALKTAFLARSKCRLASHRFPSAIVIAADTLASCQGKILGKASSRQKADRMLRLISNHRMSAVTSIALYSPKNKHNKVWSERGWVKFREITLEEIDSYLASKKWQGKAAAVNVEEKPVSGWVTERGGERGAIVGLPLKKLRAELRSSRE